MLSYYLGTATRRQFPETGIALSYKKNLYRKVNYSKTPLRFS